MTQPVATQPEQTNQSPPQSKPSPDDAWRVSEKYLIGAVLASGASSKGRKTFAESVDATGIQFTDFFSRELSALWYIMNRLYQDGKDIDLSTMWAEIQKSDKARASITLDTLTYLANQKVGGHRTHAENIVDASVSNAAKEALMSLQTVVNNSQIKASEKIRQLHKVVTTLSKRTDHASKSQTISITDGMEAFMAQYHEDEHNNTVDVGIPTGFPRLDASLDGWKKRTLNIIAGPPGSGKTVMLMNCALHAVMNNQRVLVVQLELPSDQSMRRLICAFAGIDSNRLKRHQLTSRDLSRLKKAMQMLKEFDKNKRFTLLTMNQPTLDDIKIKLDTLMLDGYDIIFFDYAGGAKISRSNSKQDDLEHHREIYNTIDEWKKSYNVPIVAGAQYGYPQPQKHPGLYTMDMIYSSKYLKHNADTITFLHPNKRKDDAVSTETSMVVVKNRDGEKPYGSNLIVQARAEMNMFRFIDSTISTSVGVPPPLWDIHQQNQPRTDDEFKDL